MVIAMRKESEDIFIDLANGLLRVIDFDNHPDEIFFIKDGAVLFQYNIVTGRMWCDYTLIWNHVRKIFHSYEDTQLFIDNLLRKELKKIHTENCFIQHALDTGIDNSCVFFPRVISGHIGALFNPFL